jgi:AbrB family looped-hinge helix DNA binding protein
MTTSTLTSEGQVTIPKEIRDRLGLREGDRLVIELDDQGQVVLRPAPRDPLGRLPGLLRHLAPERPATIEEMDEAVRRGAVRRFTGESEP